MSTHIAGLRDPGSDEHQKMLAAAKALRDADIKERPKALAKYFGYKEPESDPMAGCEVDIQSHVHECHEREGCDDWMVDLRTLPIGITHIRFTNSY